jgi:energy-coupling factor transporter ATP-binding protein EcfA2
MLTRFKVQGFKSLLDTEIELGLVNVFIGANGSGKSNLLEALGVLGAAAYGFVEPETLRYRGVRLGLPASYKSSFKGHPSRRLTFAVDWGATTIGQEAPDMLGSRLANYFLEFENLLLSERIRWRVDAEKLSNDGRQLMMRDSRSCTLYDLGKSGSQNVKISDDQTAAMIAVRIQSGEVPFAEALLRSLEEFTIYAPTTPVLRGFSDDIAREPLGLGGSGLTQALKAMIDRDTGSLGPFDLDDVWELIEWAEDVQAVPASGANVSATLRTSSEVIEFTDRFMRTEHQFVSGFDASEGALYVLFMLALVGHKDAPSIFAVDNFDQALHPRLACALTRLITGQLLKDGSRQMLATTHNPLVLDGLDLLDDRTRLFAVDRDTSGLTQIRRITVTEELMAQAQSGLSLSRLWVMGRLGGVPQAL